MAGAFLIFLREGIEASMIVSILLAYLDRLGERDRFADVLWGVAAALILSLGLGVAAYVTVHNYAGSYFQTVFETATFLLAAAIMTYMTFWMRRHARGMSKELRERTRSALSGGERKGLFLLAFQAVGREGVETVVFTLAFAFSTGATAVLSGAAFGLVVALALSVAIYRLGKRINIGLFFKVVGALLMVFAAALLADAVQNLQQLGWVPVLDHPLWNSSAALSDNSMLGDVAHSFLGYTAQPTPLQAVVWVAYLAIAVSAFLGLFGRLRTRPTAGGQDSRRKAEMKAS